VAGGEEVEECAVGAATEGGAVEAGESEGGGRIGADRVEGRFFDDFEECFDAVRQARERW